MAGHFVNLLLQLKIKILNKFEPLNNLYYKFTDPQFKRGHFPKFPNYKLIRNDILEKLQPE